MACEQCDSCKKQIFSNNQTQEYVTLKCTKWLETCDVSSNNSEFLSTPDLRSLDSFEFFDEESANRNAEDHAANLVFDNINISKSNNIHIGNINYYEGPILLGHNGLDGIKKIEKIGENLKLIINNPKYVVRVEKSKSKHFGVTKALSKGLFGFMELCMQFIDGA